MHKSTKHTSPSALLSSDTPINNCKSSRISSYIPITSLPGCKPRGSTRQSQLGLSLQTSQDQKTPHRSQMPHSLGIPSTISATISSSDSGLVTTSPSLLTASPCMDGTYEDILESFKGPYYGWHWVYSSEPLEPGTPGRICGYPGGNLQVEGAEELNGVGVGIRN